MKRNKTMCYNAASELKLHKNKAALRKLWDVVRVVIHAATENRLWTRASSVEWVALSWRCSLEFQSCEVFDKWWVCYWLQRSLTPPSQANQAWQCSRTDTESSFILPAVSLAIFGKRTTIVVLLFLHYKVCILCTVC